MTNLEALLAHIRTFALRDSCALEGDDSIIVQAAGPALAPTGSRADAVETFLDSDGAVGSADLR